jgi:hypothetical protein
MYIKLNFNVLNYNELYIWDEIMSYNYNIYKSNVMKICYTNYNVYMSYKVKKQYVRPNFYYKTNK